MKPNLTTILTLLLTLICSTPAGSARQTASLLTCDPGSEVYELCGHTALRLTDDYGHDYVVNYGVFDFSSPGFLYRFVKGETDYMCAAAPTEAFVESYRRHGREIRELPLDLTDEEIDRLKVLLTENLQPENRVYRYNYVLDNCATRPLAMIERAIADSIIMTDDRTRPEATTFRNAMRSFHRNYPWYQFGIDLALGSGIDRPINAREKTFAPLMLERQLLGARTRSGRIIAARQPHVLSPGVPGGAALGPTPTVLTPVFAGWALCVAIILITAREMRRRRRTKWVDTALFSCFGIAGCLITFLVFISTHEATSPNQLIVWLNPFCFIAAIFPWIKSLQNALKWYHFANFVVLITLLVVWPFTRQAMNPAFIPLILTSIIRSASFIYITRAQTKSSK